jgi:hypothetical protein
MIAIARGLQASTSCARAPLLIDEWMLVGGDKRTFTEKHLKKGKLQIQDP